MKPETLEALKDSIAHWKRMAENGLGEDKPTASQCALCRNFLSDQNKEVDEDNDCIGCPVKERTGRQYCLGTPYKDAHNVWMNADHPLDMSELEQEEFKSAARNEVAFLESLLPVEGAPNEPL